jgi:hypothetical protein
MQNFDTKSTNIAYLGKKRMISSRSLRKIKREMKNVLVGAENRTRSMGLHSRVVTTKPQVLVKCIKIHFEFRIMRGEIKHYDRSLGCTLYLDP